MLFPLAYVLHWLSQRGEREAENGVEGQGKRKEAPISSKKLPFFFFFFFFLAGAYRNASFESVHTVYLFTLSKDLCMPEHDKVLGGDRFSAAVGTHGATS